MYPKGMLIALVINSLIIISNGYMNIGNMSRNKVLSRKSVYDELPSDGELSDKDTGELYWPGLNNLDEMDGLYDTDKSNDIEDSEIDEVINEIITKHKEIIEDCDDEYCDLDNKELVEYVNRYNILWNEYYTELFGNI
tara:strand:- start:133 stop:546 length:414 start_codon:yes stop_codon:yes gene_type:complete